MADAEWCYGESGTTYASSYGFSMSTNLETGEDVCSFFMHGIKNVSIKSFMQKKLAKREGPCDRYHGHGACPRGIFTSIFAKFDVPKKSKKKGAAAVLAEAETLEQAFARLPPGAW